MPGNRIYIVEIIRRVVALQAISRIHQDNMVPAVGNADAVDDPVHPHQGLPDVAVHVGRIKEAAVDIIGRQQGQVVLTVLQARAGSERREGQTQETHN